MKSSEVQPGDEIIVHMGNVIPFDGEVSDGEGMVNQASLTGEAMPVRRVSGRVFMPELYWKKENCRSG